jgi:sialate O-acetylesterase
MAIFFNMIPKRGISLPKGARASRLRSWASCPAFWLSVNGDRNKEPRAGRPRRQARCLRSCKKSKFVMGYGQFLMQERFQGLKTSAYPALIIKSFILLLFMSLTPTQAAPQPSPLFGSHAILPSGTNIPVWGQAKPGEVVTVTYGESSVSATADAQGFWKATFPSLAPGLSGKMTFQGDETVVSDDVITGDVWLCTGQSNMEWTLGGAPNAADVIKDATDTQLRQFFVVPDIRYKEGDSRLKGQWQVCSPATAGAFTAVGFHFGQSIRQSEKVPVGLINASLGATCIEAWLSREALESVPSGKTYLANWLPQKESYPARREAWKAAAALWRENKAKAEKEGKPFAEPVPTLAGEGGPDDRNSPTALFNGMIQPLTPAALKGILWYQGEGNSDRQASYPELQSAFVQDLRKKFNNAQLPFLFVQLPNFIVDKIDGTGWALFREKQAETLSIPHTGMAVTIDVGEVNDIHPKDKKPVGERLARIALKKVYQRDVHDQGPVFQKMIPGPNVVRVEFDTHGKALVLKPSEGLAFEIAGEDKVFQPAQAKLEGTNSVVLSHESVPNPVAVRYCWRNAPSACLWDEEGLPAAPFRTDLW